MLRRIRREVAKSESIVAAQPTVVIGRVVTKATTGQSMVMVRDGRIPGIATNCLLQVVLGCVCNCRQHFQSLAIDTLVMSLHSCSLSHRVQATVSVVGVGDASRHHATVFAAEISVDVVSRFFAAATASERGCIVKVSRKITGVSVYSRWFGHCTRGR